MEQVKVSFIIGQLSEDEMDFLNSNEVLISKMILSPEDYRIFRYKEGDLIQVETIHGNRQWCSINNLETVEKEDGVILIFSLVKAAEIRSDLTS